MKREIGQTIGNLTILSRINKDRLICECSCGRLLKMGSRDFKRKLNNLVNIGISACGECTREFVRKNRSDLDIYRYIYNTYRKSARDRKKEFNISRETFTKLIKAPCNYCGAKDSNSRKDRLTGEYIYYNGIDRIDNSKGYSIGNVVSCCKTCNLMKRTMSVSEFYRHIERILNYKVQRLSREGVGSSESKQETPSLDKEKGDDIVSTA